MTLEILELAAHFDLGSFRRSHVELRFAVLECRDPVSEAETRKCSIGDGARGGVGKSSLGCLENFVSNRAREQPYKRNIFHYPDLIYLDVFGVT